MKKFLIGVLSLLTIGFAIHIEQINMNPFDLVTISEAEARGRRGGGHRGGRRGHRGIRRGPRVGAVVATAVVVGAVVAIGSRHTYLPSGCTSYDYHGRPYYHCGGYYYQPVYDGPEVVYVVVEKP